METRTFRLMLIVYLMLLIISGGFALLMASTGALPPPEMMESMGGVLNDAELKSHFINDLKSVLSRNAKLSETATNGFQIVLGALIGFLSAASAAFGQSKIKSAPKEN